MRVKIYQINSNRDKAHFRFSNLAETTKLMQGNGGDSSLYDEVLTPSLAPVILKKFIQNLILRGIRSIEVTRFLYPT